ncbi:MAG TPA: GNAT family protein [Thermomicrobiales bacterium]|nr:GNAT family protein [Thermomicrobiales bacterium]
MSPDLEHADAPIVNISGDLVLLGPLDRALVPLYQRWLNDFSHVRNFADTPEPWTMARALALFEARAATLDDTNMFTIYERVSLCPIGYTMLVNISFRHRSAEFAIHIGERSAHGKGYGTQTTRLMLDYAFTSLLLHSVYLTVAAYNHAGRRVYLRAGFRETGRRRQAWQMGGQFWDEIIMDCLASEYTDLSRTSAS